MIEGIGGRGEGRGWIGGRGLEMRAGRGIGGRGDGRDWREGWWKEG